MFIRKMENKDIAGCAEILCAVYNNDYGCADGIKKQL